MITDQALIEEIHGSKMRVRVGEGKFKEIDLDQIFAIDKDQLSHEFSEQAAIYAYFAQLLTRAEHAMNESDANKDSEYALADLSYREDAVLNDKKLTETQVKSLIMSDEGYNKLVKFHIVRQYDFKLIKAIVTALEMRAEMLVSLGAQVRNEISMTGMNMKEAAYEHTVDSTKAILAERKNARGQV